MFGGAILRDWLASGTIVASAPGKLLIGWGERRWYNTPTKISSEIAFYFPDFFLREDMPWFEHDKVEEVALDELLDQLSEETTKNSITSRIADWQSPYHFLFKSTFEDLQCKFAAKEIDKAVPFVFESSPTRMTSHRLIHSLRNLLEYAKRNPVYAYGFWDQEQGILGVTPELLFRFDESNRLETMACAGTRSLRDDMSELLKDPKELHEHSLVVQGIRESLSQFGEISIGERELLRLPNVAHLATQISVKLKQLPDFEIIVRALHPTPALGAFPRKQGMQWLESYQQKIDRKRFGAPVGYVQAKRHQASCYVAIRNAQWDKNSIQIGAGCGVVPASECDREWAEINLKLQAIKELLSL